jgi:hypothetical protein
MGRNGKAVEKREGKAETGRMGASERSPVHMQRRRVTLVGLVACGIVVLAVGVPGARSAGPGTWSEVQGPLPALGQGISVLRNGDGTTLVAYLDQQHQDLDVSRVGADGTRQSTVTAIAGMTGNGTDEPALVRDPGGSPRLIFGGLRQGTGGSGFAVYTSLGNAAGTAWGSPGPAGGQLPGTSIAAATAPDGTPYFVGAAFNQTGSGSVVLHRGLDAHVANQPIQGPGSANHPGVGIDGATGGVWAGWTTGSPLRFDVRATNPATGAPTGAVVTAPGTGGGPASLVDPGGVNGLSLSGRIGHPGVFAAYVDTADRSELLLWKVGDPTPRVVASSTGNIGVANLAPAPDGALWIVWQDTTAGVQTIQARELLADGSTLGPITKLAIPLTPQFLNVEALAGSAAADRVDVVLAGYSNDALRLYDQQVLAPSGPIGPAGRTVISGRATGTDGRPVAGATVQACPTKGGSCPATITESDGTYQLVGIAPGSYQLTSYPPAHRILNVTAHAGVSTVAAGHELSGQDIVMSGPLPLARGVSISGPGSVAVVGGVPVIVRNQPIWLGDDIVFPDGSPTLIEPPVVSIYAGTNPDTPDTTKPFFTSPLIPIFAGVIPLPPREDCDSPNPPPACLSTPGGGSGGGGGGGNGGGGGGSGTGTGVSCPPDKLLKCGRWGLWVSVHSLQLGPHAGWTMCFTYGFTRIPALVPVRHCNTVWIDPSGHVRTTRGVELPHATVTLLRSRTAKGHFTRVANGSAVMSPGNRHNPDRTDPAGHFGWDVVSGYYRVQASHEGCTDPRNRHRRSVITRAYRVPPPVDNIVLKLRCPDAPQVATRPTVHGSARVGHVLTCVAGRWRNKPAAYAYAWRRGQRFILGATKRRLKLARADRKQRLSCLVAARNRFGQRAAASRPVKVR